MTDPQRPPDDELVSAYLDGEATADERALVEADPELLRQVEVMRQVSRQTASVPPPLAGVREANVVAALGVFDAEIATPTHAPIGAEEAPVAPVGLAAPPIGVGRPGAVSDLDAARRRKQSRRMTVLGAAAAVILVVVIAAGLVVKSNTRTSDVAATAAAPSSTANPTAAAEKADRAPGSARNAEGNAGAATGKRPSPTAPPTTTAAGPRPTNPSPDAGTSAAPNAPSASDSGNDGVFVGDLGSLTAGASFRSEVAKRLDQIDADRQAGRSPSPSTAPTATASQLASCATKLRSRDAELGSTVMTGTATVGGKPALVIAYEVDPAITNANGAFRVYAVTPDCSVLDSQTV